jgi:hypothetical protein
MDDINYLRQQITHLENANKNLKEYITQLAMEQCDYILEANTKKTKRKVNPQIKERWEFYHKNKTYVKSIYSNTKEHIYWQFIKKETDKMYFAEKK